MKQNSTKRWMMQIYIAGVFILILGQLISCSSSKHDIHMAQQQEADQEVQEPQAQQTGLLVVSDSSLTTSFKINSGNGVSSYNGKLITVKHDGCEYIIWFNEWGQQVIHKPNCSNYIHKQ